MKIKEFSFRQRAASFRFAFDGLRVFLMKEHNSWIHFVATVLVLSAAFWLDLRVREVILLIMVIGFVWVAEIFNTAIERMMDFVSPGYHPQVKLIKDLSAGAVLVAAITAFVTGLIIFIPKIF